MLLLLISCLSAENPPPTEVDAATSSAATNACAEDAELSPTEAAVVEVNAFSQRGMADSHGDHYESGIECRTADSEWECRSYRSHHPFSRDDLPDRWTAIPDSKNWGALLNNADFQALLKVQKTKNRNKEPGPPRRGGSSTIAFQWDGGSKGIPRHEAPEAVLPLFAALNQVSKQIDAVQPRYQLEMGQRARVGLHEIAWLDEQTGLKLKKCENKDTQLELLQSGRVLDVKKLKIRDKLSWESGGYRFDIDFVACGRKNYVSLTPQKD